MKAEKTSRKQIKCQIELTPTIRLNLNDLNVTTERQALAQQVKNVTPPYACYKRPTANVKKASRK